MEKPKRRNLLQKRNVIKKYSYGRYPRKLDELSSSKTTIYQTITDHWQHAEDIRWTLLNNYFVGSSILLLAWTALFTSHPRSFIVGPLLLGLSLLGVFISSLWVCIQFRANGFVETYIEQGVKWEKTIQNEINPDGPFIASDIYRKEKIRGLARVGKSGFVCVIVPFGFWILYVFLIGVSIKLHS